MNVRYLALVAASITMLSAAHPALAQGTRSPAESPEIMSEEGIQRISIFDSLDEEKTGTSQSNVRQSKMSISELRQARALYRSNQRAARLEYNLWIGHEPLRPRWNSIPMMSSRYAPRTIYVPVFVYGR